MSPGVAPSAQTPSGIPANGDNARFTRHEVTWTNRLTPLPGLDAALGVDMQAEHGVDDGFLQFGPRLPTHFALDRTLWAGFAEARYRITPDFSLSGHRARDLPRTTPNRFASGTHDPKSGVRFSDKIMRREEGGGAPKGASNQFRAAPANVAACRCPGAEARHADKCTQSAHLSVCGARSPFGATPRLSPGLSHPGSAPGHASWDSVRAGITRPLSQSSGSTPRLGRSTEGNDARSRSGAACEPARKHRTRSTLQIASGMRP